MPSELRAPRPWRCIATVALREMGVVARCTSSRGGGDSGRGGAIFLSGILAGGGIVELVCGDGDERLPGLDVGGGTLGGGGRAIVGGMDLSTTPWEGNTVDVTTGLSIPELGF